MNAVSATGYCLSSLSHQYSHFSVPVQYHGYGFLSYLDEFTDEIEPWIIDELKRVGCDTGRAVLDLTAEELERRTDLEKETIDEVRRILKEEFENE